MKNIIYFNPDEMRADVLSCYGHPLVKTPNIDRLAAQGTVFDQCHVQHTVCTPSRCSFMTGWYPHVNGHRTLWNPLQNDEPNTMRYLKQGGYDVRWFGKNDLLAPDAFESSVTKIHCNRQPGEVSGENHRIGERGDKFFQSFLFEAITDGEFNDYHLVQRAIDYLKNRKDGDPPFMLYLPITFPHCPYRAPEPWHSMYNPEDLPDLREVVTEGKPDFYSLIRKYRNLDQLTDLELKKIMAVYLGMVSYVDHLLGLLLDALEEVGEADNTAIFYFSDHGDWAGDYGLVEKWPSGMDDCLTRIPMVVSIPGGASGHVVKEPVECFDIMPTTLELAGLTAQHTHFAQSMMPQLNGASGDADRAVFAEGGYAMHEPHCFEGKTSDGVCADTDGVYYPKGLQQQENPESAVRSTMIRTMDYKLIRRPDGTHELYDFTKDPNEINNLYNDEAYNQVRLDLQERMLDWYIKTSDVTPWKTDPRGFEGAPEFLKV